MKYQFQVILMLFFAANNLNAQTETCLQNLNHPDLHVLSQVIGSDTVFREYILHIPQNYDENIASSLIINLHGFGDCASDYSETIGDFYNFNELANQENIIVAYPQGAYRPEKEDTYWEPGDTGIENIYENDIYFIEELISTISSQFNLNLDMVYACGYSNGGMMTYSLACNRSTLFSAIGIMSGTMLDEDCTLDSAIPIITFHGIGDEVLPYNGNIWYQSVDEVVNFWLDLNDISAASQISTELNGGNVVRDEYFGGSQNSCLSLYTINEEFDKPGDHVWFSEEIEGVTPNRIMWNFFKENCSTVSSINKLDEDIFTLYPNPFTKQLIINHAMHEEYSIYDINGILLLKDKLNSNTETVNLTQLPSGFYTIKIAGQVNKFLKIE